MDTTVELQGAINYLLFSSHPIAISASLAIGVGLCLLLSVSIVKHENAAFKKHEYTQQ